MTDASTQSYTAAAGRTYAVSEEDTLGSLIEGIYSFLQRRRIVICALIALGVLLGVVKTMNTVPTYQAAASLLIERRESQVAGVQIDESKSIASTTVDNEVQSLQSPELMDRVVQRLNLTRDAQFNPYAAPGVARPPQLTLEAEKRLAADNLAASIRIQRIGLSFVINVVASSQDPAMAAKLANTVAEEYLANQLDAKLLSTRQAGSWLQQQVTALETELERQSTSVQSERAASGMMAGSSGSSVADQQVRALTAQLSDARSELAAKDARLGTSARLGVGASSAGEVLASPVIQGLRQRESEASRKIGELRITFGPQHPQMQAAIQERQDIESQIQEETARIVRGNSSEVEVARRRVESLQTDLNRWTAALANDTRRASRLQQLEGQAEATRTTYQNYVTRLQQVTDLEKLQRPDARIIAQASTPRGPSAPNPVFDVALGFIFGTFLSLMIAIMLDALQRGLKTPQAIEQALGSPCLVSIPALTRKEIRLLKKARGRGPADFILRKPLSVYSEAFRKLRADLLLGNENGTAPTVVAFTSALPGEGKSTTALSFARTMAQSGVKTLLLEADFRRPTLATVAGVEPRMAVADAVRKPELIESALVADPISTLMMMPTLVNTDRQGVDSALDSFKDFIETLKEQFEFIVIDTAPILAVAETQIIAKSADAVVLVVRWDRTNKDAAVLAMRALDSSLIKLRGSILNGVNLAVQSRYRRGDASTYYAYHKGYYTD
jgi:polysaccharide biosynthesis transport protein